MLLSDVLANSQSRLGRWSDSHLAAFNVARLQLFFQVFILLIHPAKLFVPARKNGYRPRSHSSKIAKKRVAFNPFYNISKKKGRPCFVFKTKKNSFVKK